MGVNVHEIHLRSMRTKWASLSTEGRLTLNDQFVGLRDDLCDYVIVHELVHLKVRNHGKLFKSLMYALPAGVGGDGEGVGDGCKRGTIQVKL